MFGCNSVNTTTRKQVNMLAIAEVGQKGGSGRPLPLPSILARRRHAQATSVASPVPTLRGNGGGESGATGAAVRIQK